METFDEQMQQRELDTEEQYKILYDVVACGMARLGKKTLSFAYKQMPYDDLYDLMNRCHIESDEFRQELESNLVYLGTFGINDPVRENIEESIQLIRFGSSLAENVDRSKGAKN
jgi:magnesium-transporting ATPase (P-type)